MHPLILVVSDSKETTAENIIAKIRDKPSTDSAHTLADGCLGFLYEISNKYYTVNVYLCPISGGEEAVSTYPLLSKVEGFLIYFDASDKQFLTATLPKYLPVAENCDPECKILLCDKLFEEEQEGITYGALKSKCTLWDVIELSREVTEEDAEDSALNPIGYDELRDALQNIIWSNVEYSSGSEALGNHEGMNELIAQLTGATFTENHDDAEENATGGSTATEELDVFEKILTQLLTVQSNTANWSRNERLAYMHDMATALDNIVEKED